MKFSKSFSFIFFNLTIFTFFSFVLYSYMIYFGFFYDFVSMLLLFVTALIQSCAAFKNKKLFGGTYLIMSMSILFFSIKVGGINGYYTTIASGNSSNPTVKDGDYIVVSPILFNFERGVFVHFKLDDGRDYAKRIHGLPGDKINICDDKVYVNDYYYSLENNWIGSLHGSSVCSSRNESFILGADEYFLLGDNPSDSIDSRHFGAVNTSNIRGKVLYKFGQRYGFDSISVDVSFRQ